MRKIQHSDAVAVVGRNTVPVLFVACTLPQKPPHRRTHQNQHDEMTNEVFREEDGGEETNVMDRLHNHTSDAQQQHPDEVHPHERHSEQVTEFQQSSPDDEEPSSASSEEHNTVADDDIVRNNSHSSTVLRGDFLPTVSLSEDDNDGEGRFLHNELRLEHAEDADETNNNTHNIINYVPQDHHHDELEIVGGETSLDDDKEDEEHNNEGEPNDDDEDDDNITVIPLTTSTLSAHFLLRNAHHHHHHHTIIPPPPPPMHTIFWLEQNTPDMERLRRRIVEVTLCRVERNAALTMSCLCLVPLLLVLVIVVAARELVGTASHCHDPTVLAMNTTCRRLPRSFINAVCIHHDNNQKFDKKGEWIWVLVLSCCSFVLVAVLFILVCVSMCL